MKIDDIDGALARELSIKPHQAKAARELLDEGNTVPFIARYRKEATGSLEDEQIRKLEERLAYLRNLIKRQEETLTKIEEQGKLTDELRAAIEGAQTLQEVEDLYLPYKQKKRTRAQIAREKGLEPLAARITLQEDKDGNLRSFAQEFVDAESGVETAEDALLGAQDILAEAVSEDAKLRAALRERLKKQGILQTTLKGAGEEAEIFRMYADYEEPIRTLPPHRILAINRGEKKDFLTVKLSLDVDAQVDWIYKTLRKKPSIYDEILKAVARDSYKRLLFPAIEREIRAALTETAEAQAIHVFGENLRQLLLQPPLAGHTVLGLDPGYRTGCKVAVVDATGAVLAHDVIQVTQSEGAKAAAETKILALIKKHNITLVSIGNGTASFETESFMAELIKKHNLQNVHYLITNEAGASVYSASKLAKEELPEYDVTIRGAVSIARRVQDPLAELVKIDPEAIGVGQYQHDVNAKALHETLDATIETAVNHVGVELNTASPALLSHIAGISSAVAKNIVAYRTEHGRFSSRKELLKVARLGPAAFTQCAGFLRIAGGKTPFDATSVHPESYELAEKILEKLGFLPTDLTDKASLESLAVKRKLLQKEQEERLAKELSAGLPTVHDILDALVAPGRDPRADLPAPLTRQAIVKLSDMKVGTILKGTVRNITDFGVFVDIGIKTAGLIHISELAPRRVKHPLDVVSVGDILEVLIISVDEERNRIGLSLKQVPAAKKKEASA